MTFRRYGVDFVDYRSFGDTLFRRSTKKRLKVAAKKLHHKSNEGRGMNDSDDGRVDSFSIKISWSGAIAIAYRVKR